MCELEIVTGKKKSQHVDVEAYAWYVVACHTIRKKVSEVKKHNEEKVSTYIVLGCILLRRKVPDNVANIPCMYYMSSRRWPLPLKCTP